MSWIHEEHMPLINYYMMLAPFILAAILIIRKHYNSTPIEVIESGSFLQDIRDGLTSNNFDLNQNNTDLRDGLGSSDEIKNIMLKYKCDFDEARLIRQRELMIKNNIDPDTGLPLDAKAVY
ncbi:hypothetical protein K502DRAFT_322973 [Neoconidiobolus thromboides FSU 785]|nr:hypothetical protein K502DRAFT_322973 [Neoconidiobolus thromboides FSU 785]